MSAGSMSWNGRTILRPALPVLRASSRAWLVSSRWASSARLRSKPTRMALSPNVAKDSLKKKDRARSEKGPWSNLNQTTPRLRGEAKARSQAAIKRSSRGREGEEEGIRKKEESPLYKALKMQTTLSPLSYGLRNVIKEKIASIMNFDQFKLLPVVQDSILTQALPDLVDVSPTPIQSVAIPALLLNEDSKKTTKKKKTSEIEYNYEQFLLAAETGSGKTLAYLVPLIDNIKRTEMAEKIEEEKQLAEKAKESEKRAKERALELEPPELSENLTTSAGRPRAIILLPTSELVSQVGAKVKAFSHTVKFRSGHISSSDTPRKIRNVVFNPAGIDILVSTPHLLASIAKTDPYVLSRVQHIVVDEADSLLDRSFGSITTGIIDKAAGSLKQLILCSATIPRSLDTFLRKRYPDVRRLATPNLHAIPRRVQLGVVDIEKEPFHGNRSLACADIIWSIAKSGETESMGEYNPFMEKEVRKIIVFVNEREEAEEVAQFLQNKGIDAIPFSRDSSKRSQELVEEFTSPRRPPTTEEIMEMQKMRRIQKSSLPFILPEEQQEFGVTKRLPNTKVMVTTDLGSRGIDTLPVRTVILYHVPHTTIDFIHRLGRVGRMGKRGRGIVLVGKKDRKDVVREVREAMFRGQALI
ncbi:ATP-dependent RNA helicase Mrh4, putative [Talaromyces stipitatus ATCC 10500]|uniref:RNA helicase n=1 Tax=Talaromyces stipitatus (strain ATCC 10500 / CBS 375.48 / QM 6759 / NRRL 1006) TaxID=441959 RepID=B8M1I3_TALSN|nr:ATP-dependent RNA helicase Mrh4, putative [Talaromyces stipitatus ATCC 10500]EED21879.1 ATP-dependent RNA helicase Mrh4, putative [Talaromyces stipitatus ATCC 10500]